MEDEREQEPQTKAKRRTREQLLKSDLQGLMLSAPFRRFVYCILMDSNLLRGGYGANQATLQWWEGRRSLGLDILATLQGVDPDALLKLLTEEAQTRTETNIGRRTTDRRDELTGSGDPDGRRRSDGLDYLDYGGEQSDLRRPAE